MLAQLSTHFVSGGDLRRILTPLLLTMVLVASWALRPESCRVKRN
jgi:hypothetical protein